MWRLTLACGVPVIAYRRGGLKLFKIGSPAFGGAG